MAMGIHETERAIFQFELADAIKGLSVYAIQRGVDKANDLFDFLTSSPADSMRTAGGCSELFGYIASDLLSQSKGYTFPEGHELTEMVTWKPQIHSMNE